MEPDDLPTGEYAFKYLDSQGATLSTLPFDVDFSVDNGALLTGTQLTQASFVFAIPIVPNAAKIQVMEGQEILAEKVISANSPHVTLINPAGGSTHLNSVTIEWTEYTLWV